MESVENESTSGSSNSKDGLPKEWRHHKNQSKDNMLIDSLEKMVTRSVLRKMIGNVAFVSQIEPKVFEEAQDDENWMLTIQEELNHGCLEIN